MQKSIMAYILAALMLSTAVVYFVAAAEESAEGGESGEAEQAATGRSDLDNDEASERAASEGTESGLATQTQTAFFTITGLGYASVGAWMLKDKGKTNAPYIIAIAGSISIIGLYVASRTTDLPVVGLQDDVGSIDILSKVLQVAIVAASAYVINSNKVLRPIPGRQGRK